LRIVCVAHSYPRWDGDIAGAFIERLCVALVTRGHVLRLIAPSDQGKGGREVRGGVRVTRVRYASARRETLAYRGTMAEAARRPSGIQAAWQLIGAMRRGVAAAMREEPADVIHAHWWVPGGLAAAGAVRRSGLPYVLTLHGTDVAILTRSWIARRLARPAFRRAAAITAVSQYLADTVLACGVTSRSLAVQPMPSPVPTPRAGGTSGIATVGRLTRQKRLDLLLRAMPHLADPSLSLRIVGDGPERPHLEHLAATLGIATRVRFVGAVAPDAVGDAVAGADVFAFPARGEGFGLAVAEALGLGIPVVVAEDGGGVMDIVTSEAGRIVRADDPRALARAIDALKSDPVARTAAVRAGESLRRRLAPETVAAAFETVYERALAGPA